MTITYPQLAFSISFAPLAILLALIIVDALCHYWFRKDEWCAPLSNYWQGKLNPWWAARDAYGKSEREEAWLGTIAIYVFGVGAVGGLILWGMFSWVGLSGMLLFAGITAGTLLVPRILIDIAKSIKFNPKTGKAERIDQLEKELAELKAKDVEK